MKDAFHRQKRANEQASPQHKTISPHSQTDSATPHVDDSRYLNLFESAPISYFILNSQGTIMEVNLAGARLLGVGQNELRQCDLANYVAPACQELYEQKLKEVSVHAGQQSYDLQVMRAGNEACYVRMNVSPQVTADGKTLLYVAVIDITQQKLAEERLWERNKYINSLFTFASEPIAVWDASLRLTMVNPAVEKLTGYSADELVGQPVRLLFSSDLAEFLTSGAQFSIEGQQLASLEEVTMYPVSGAVRFISWTSAPVYADDGQTVLSIIAQGQDITERIQIEHGLHVASSGFEAQLGMLIIDLDSRVVRVNGAFSRLTDYSRDEVVGWPICSLFGPIHENDSFFRDLWNTVNREHYWQGELRDFRKNGESSPVLMTITAVFGGHGQVTHYVGSFVDISAQKEAETLLQNRQLQLEKLVEQTVAELNQLKEETTEANTALKVMIKLREAEALEAKRNLLLELQQEVMPFLRKLERASSDSKQIRLLSTLDANLQRLVTSYGCTMGISSLYRNLTPKEIQVACMVREGLPTKVIAATLSISPETVSIHRKNIRKKLGLETKADNLRSYLVTLVDSSRVPK